MTGATADPQQRPCEDSRCDASSSHEDGMSAPYSPKKAHDISTPSSSMVSTIPRNGQISSSTITTKQSQSESVESTARHDTALPTLPAHIASTVQQDTTVTAPKQVPATKWYNTKLCVAEARRVGDHTEYNIVMCDKYRQELHSCWRRFRDLDVVFSAVRRRAEKTGGSHVAAKLPNPPSKKIFTARFDAALIAERQLQVNAFLSAAQKIAETRDAPELRDILEADVVEERLLTYVPTLSDEAALAHDALEAAQRMELAVKEGDVRDTMRQALNLMVDGAIDLMKDEERCRRAICAERDDIRRDFRREEKAMRRGILAQSPTSPVPQAQGEEIIVFAEKVHNSAPNAELSAPTAGVGSSSAQGDSQSNCCPIKEYTPRPLPRRPEAVCSLCSWMWRSTPQWH